MRKVLVTLPRTQVFLEQLRRNLRASGLGFLPHLLVSHVALLALPDTISTMGV
ncbi:7301_t:CDS:1, partial [Acaulospora colombiana]